MSTILLTGAGGAAIPDLIRHLQGLGHRVLTCDMDPHAAGLYLGDGGFVVPKATDPEFVGALCRTASFQCADILIPLVDEELPLSRKAWPQTVLLPTDEFVQTCLDKWNLIRTLRRDYQIHIPYSSLFDGLTEPWYPAIIKPRVGRGSRGVHRFEHHGELQQALIDGRIRYSPDLIAQEYIDGPEYTVSVVVDQSNTVHAVVPKRIILKQGATRLAVTERNYKIDFLCREIAEKLNPCGPFNVQLRLRDGKPYIFEINPRFSGTVNLTIAAGCDEVGGLIELALGHPYTFGEWREGVVLVRQTHDATMDLGEFQGKAPKTTAGEKNRELAQCEF